MLVAASGLVGLLLPSLTLTFWSAGFARDGITDIFQALMAVFIGLAYLALKAVGKFTSFVATDSLPP